MDNDCNFDKKGYLNYLKNELEKIENSIDYKYNNDGILHKKNSKERPKRLEQDEYEKVGNYVLKYIQYKILSEYDLLPMFIPLNPEKEFRNLKDFLDPDNDIAQCQIYCSEDFFTNPKCLIIIQGTGAVRIGIWSRQICINDCIEFGSMISYIKTAKEKKYSLIILNPNERNDDNKDKNKIIKEFPTMEKHCNYVYNNIIKNNDKIEEIYIVAHSMGGYCTVDILKQNKDDLLNGKIKKIAFTDSVHGGHYKILDEDSIKIFKKISRNYVTSDEKVGKLISNRNKSYDGVDNYSSGHIKHEYTSSFALLEIFEWFEEKEDKNKSNCKI